MKIKILFRILLALILAFTLFWIAAWGFLRTERGQQWAVNAMVHLVEDHTKILFASDHIDIFFPLGFRAENISISDNGKPIACADEIEIFCDYWQLLEGRLIFSLVKAKNINLLALPSSKVKSEGNFKFHGKALIPFYIKMEKIAFENIWLSPSVIQELSLPPFLAEQIFHSRFNLKGTLTNNPFKNTLSSQIFIDLEDESGSLEGNALALSLANHHFSLSFHAKKISRQFEMGNERVDFDVAVALSAAGPLNSWFNTFSSEEGNQESPVAGSFKIIAYPNNEKFLTATCGQEIIMKGKYSLQPGLMIGIENFHLTCSGINLRAKGKLSSNFHIYDGSFEGEIDEMAALSPLIQKKLKGPLALSGQAAGPLSFLKFFINGTSPAFTVQEKSFKNLETTVSAAYAENGTKGFIKILFDYDEAPCDFASSFQWNGQQLLLEDLKGVFLNSTAKGNLSFTMNAPLCNGHIEIQSDSLHKLSSYFGEAVEGRGNAIISLTHFLDKSGAECQRIESDFAIQNLKWNNFSSGQFSGHFAANMPDKDQPLFHVESHLTMESALFTDLSAGRIALNATHQIDLNHLTILNLFTQGTAEKIIWAGGKADRGIFDLYLPEPLQRNGKIRFAFENIEAFSSSFEELHGETSIDFNQPFWPFDLEGKGKWHENWAFALNGQWNLKESSLNLHFLKLNGFFEGASFFLLNPVILALNQEKIQISETHLKWGQVEIEGHFLKEEQKIDLQFSTNSMQADLLNHFFPNFPVEGAASLKGFFKGPADNPFGEIQLALHQLTVPENLGVKKTSLRGKVDLAINHSGIQINSLLYGVGASPFCLYGTLPYQLSFAPFTFQPNSAIPLSINLEAEGDIDPFVDLFYNDLTHLTGHAKIALNLSGELNAPLLKGSVDLENGTYENINSGSLYQHIKAHFEGDGTKVYLRGLSAENTHGGTLAATGTIELDKKKDFPFEFFIKPKKIFIVESENANISASGSLRFSGNKKKSKLEGELSTDTAAIDLEGALPKQIKSLEVKYINLPKGEEPFQPEAPKINSSVEFDIKLNIPNNLMVEGKKLTSRWKGGLLIAGTPKNPLLFGDMRVSEGEYNFNGKVFDLTQGTIHFSGPPAKKTSIYVVASKDIGKIKADIIVKGPTNKLTVSFRSSPSLSQREILSYILFNRGISDITPDQGDQLTQSFIALNETDSAGGDDFLTKLRNNIGLDRLDILPQSFQVGKYITEGVIVSIDKTKDLGNRLIIEADVLKNLKAQAEVKLGGEAQQKFSLKWKKDY